MNQPDPRPAADLQEFEEGDWASTFSARLRELEAAKQVGYAEGWHDGQRVGACDGAAFAFMGIVVAVVVLIALGGSW